MNSPLVRPVGIDPTGRAGPTKGSARGPRWRRSSPGLYVPAEVDRGRVEQRILEESARLPPSGAVGGWAALRLHGTAYLDGLGADGRTEVPVPLLVPRGLGIRAAPWIDVRRVPVQEGEVVLRHGIRTADPAWAAFDAAARAESLRNAVGVLDLAFACGVTSPGDLRTYGAARPGARGVRQVLAAMSLTDPRTMSPRETEFRLIWLLDAGLPRPLCNWPVADADGRFIGRPDLLSTELGVVGEFDGAEHRTRRQQQDDVRRDDAFRSVGLKPFRVVGADLDDVGLVVDRIRRAVDRAVRSTTPRTWRIQTNPRPVQLPRAT